MKTAIVFYADILGFKEMVHLSNDAINNETFEKLKEAIEAIDGTMAELQQQEWNNQILKDIVTYKMFSDSFYLSISYDEKSLEELNKAIWLTFHIARIYQDTMLMQQILIRGAISKGADYNDKNFIFSPALIKAYTLECTIAIYPRIVIDDEIISDLKKAKVETRIFPHRNEDNHNRSIIYDWSDVYFLNPFIMLQLVDDSNMKQSIVTILGYGIAMGKLANFLTDEQKRLRELGKRAELDKNLWMERLFHWVVVKNKEERPPSLIEFAYLSFDTL